MKKSKFLVILLLLVFLCSGLVTYALFRTNKSGNATIDAARWNIVFKNGESEIENNFNIQLSNAEWTNPLGNVASGKIAPGSQATFYITLDATNTETDVYYEAVIGDSFNDPDFEVTVGEDSGVISYSTTSGAMVKQIPITVVWNGNINDSETKNSDDLLKKAQNITIPVTITAAQKLALKYTVIFNDGLGNTVLTKKVSEGDTVGTLPADPTREKYVFLGWYDDIENGNEVTSSTLVTSGMNIYAHWEQWRGRIPVVSDSSLAQEAYDGDLTTYASMTRDSWRYLKLPNDAEEYKINIVFRAANSTGTGFGIAFFDENKQVIEPKYEYTSTGNNDNGFIALGQLLTTQQTCTLLIPPNTSYLGLEKVDCSNDVYVYDIYLSEKENVTVSFNTHDVNVPAPQSIQIKEGNNISSIPTISRPGYYFEGWYTLENGGEKLTTNTKIIGNTEYHARYIEEVTVSFDSNGGSSVSPINVAKGFTLDQIPTSILSGYVLAGWFDINDNKLTTSTSINDDITYTAKWRTDIPVSSQSTLSTNAYDGDLTTYVSMNRNSWLYLKLPDNIENKRINIVFNGASNTGTGFGIAFFDENKQILSPTYIYTSDGKGGNGFTALGKITTDITTGIIEILSNASYIGVEKKDCNNNVYVYDMYLTD